MAAGLINIVLLIYLIKNKKKSTYTKQIALGILQGLLYLPWLIYFASQLRTMHENEFWIKVNSKTIIDILSFSFSGNLNQWIGLAISIFTYGYLIYLIKKNGIKDSKPAVFAILIYLLVIIAALVMTKIIGTGLLYYRYLIIVTGLTFFAISFMYAKAKKPYLVYAFILITIVTGIASNVIMMKNNYYSSNMKDIEYLKANIKEGDVIIYQDIGCGAIFAVNFPEYKQYFYNEGNWGVEEAYKAFGPGMDTYITTDFLKDEECQGRIWIIFSQEGDNFYEKYLDSESYQVVSQKDFKTKYYEESMHKIVLIEKNK